MYEIPLTVEQAREYRYNVCSDNLAGDDFIEDQCAYEIIRAHKRGVGLQCLKSPGYGPGGAYCKVHGRKVAKWAKEKPDHPGPLPVVMLDGRSKKPGGNS